MASMRAEAIRQAGRLERRAAATDDADDAKAAAMLRVLAAVWATEGGEDDGAEIHAVH